MTDQPTADWEAEYRKAWLAMSNLANDLEEVTDILSDLYDLHNEAEFVGTWPGFKERHAAAWKRVEEYFQP